MSGVLGNRQDTQKEGQVTAEVERGDAFAGQGIPRFPEATKKPGTASTSELSKGCPSLFVWFLTSGIHTSDP